MSLLDAFGELFGDAFKTIMRATIFWVVGVVVIVLFCFAFVVLYEPPTIWDDIERGQKETERYLGID